jgi:hypothetical protein
MMPGIFYQMHLSKFVDPSANQCFTATDTILGETKIDKLAEQ